MNLTFGVCWIEDQASDAEVDGVETAIRSAGFEPAITRIESESEISDFASRQNHFQEYELILLDLRLGKGLRGNKLAVDVRRSFRSTPILFYSAEDEAKLRKMMADELIEGAYCAHRDRLPLRVGELVSNMSPALNRLAGMRGLAARVVAECDFELRTIIKNQVDVVRTDVGIVELIKAAINKSTASQAEALDKISEIDELLSSHFVSGAVAFNVVIELLGDVNDDDVRAARSDLRKKYLHQVIMRRNVLAHALEEHTANGWVIRRSSGGRDLTANDFTRYRKDFMRNLDAIRKLRMLLIPEQV